MKATMAIGFILLLFAAGASAEHKTPIGLATVATLRTPDSRTWISCKCRPTAAWTFHTGVLDPNSELEVSPVKVEHRLYITDGHDDVFALNAATGKQLWSYKPTEIPGEMPSLDKVFACCGLNNRGVVFVPGGPHRFRFGSSA